MVRHRHHISKNFVYFLAKQRDGEPKQDDSQPDQHKVSNVLDKLLLAVGREALRETAPSLQALEQILQDILVQELRTDYQKNNIYNSKMLQPSESITVEDLCRSGMPIVRQLIGKGYLKDSPRWISNKGFKDIGRKILNDVLKALKPGEFGMHESKNIGAGSFLLDTTREYEQGNDFNLINVPKSLLNTIQRQAGSNRKLEIPFDFHIEDFEEYETVQDLSMAVVYCIDLSSTMRYSTMFGDLSRIEAAKRALWSLYILNRKSFPSDSVYIVGFGALASKVAPQDIPYLKTFEPGSDFLHYTNYQAAFRLASKILQRDGAFNKRIVLITDGHPSACFIDDKSEQDMILSQRPYSHFYTPSKELLDSIKLHQDIKLETGSGELIYLCYRYRQVDPYIGQRTIVEARKCRNKGIVVDTIMISEDDSLLGYVNEMEKYVKGRSYYINPGSIDKILLNDYLENKKQTIHAQQ